MKTVERDVSWMYFNRRILDEATRQGVPPLERLTFLGIYSNNLDEFFRVRVASLRRIAQCKEKRAHDEAKHAQRLLKTINALNTSYAADYQTAVAAAWHELEGEGIHVVSDTALTPAQREFVGDLFRRSLMGRVMPLWSDRLKAFDKEADDTIYLAVRLRLEGKKAVQAILTVPVDEMGRWVCLPDEGQNHYVMYLDDVLRAGLPLLFPGLTTSDLEAYSFKFTRDAEMDVEGDPTLGFMQKIRRGVAARKEGAPLRLVYDEQMPDAMVRSIKAMLGGGGKLDTAIAGGRYQNHRDLMRFPSFGRADLKYPRWEPVRPQWLTLEQSLFDTIRECDRFLHVPYHSFDGYIRLLDEAAINPRVKTIKTTLYRLAKDSKVVKALIAAAQNGKHVTVCIELLARFDESANIGWSQKMREAGVEVIFGVEGLKVHSKITLITFTKGTPIACISTGNFHEGNATAYTDIVMMTARRNITSDVERVFRFIRQPYAPVHFRELLVSPNDMKRSLTALIAKEVRNYLAGRPAYIKAKVNHITDPDIVAALYAAAEAGVPVSLLVRGNCALAPDPRLAGRLRVVGIIGRYLEHSRIYRFANGGDERLYIGSADWMPRNLDCRIEVVTPVYDDDIRQECQRIVDYGLRDNVEGRTVIGTTTEGDAFRSQEQLYLHYKE